MRCPRGSLNWTHGTHAWKYKSVKMGVILEEWARKANYAQRQNQWKGGKKKGRGFNGCGVLQKQPPFRGTFSVWLAPFRGHSEISPVPPRWGGGGLNPIYIRTPRDEVGHLKQPLRPHGGGGVDHVEGHSLMLTLHEYNYKGSNTMFECHGSMCWVHAFYHGRCGLTTFPSWTSVEVALREW